MVGCEKIKIPVRGSEATYENVKDYLPDIFAKFRELRGQIKNRRSVYDLKQEILSKTREHSDTKINSIVLLPHTLAIVDFKVGYLLGNPIKYARTNSEQGAGIEILNKYIRASGKRNVDQEVLEWAYATGVGYYYIAPSMIESESESPFDVYSVDSTDCAKVYSSYLGEEELFDIIYTPYKRRDENIFKHIDSFGLFFKDEYVEVERSMSNEFKVVKEEERKAYKKLPLVEKRPNQAGIGIVEKTLYMQNAVNDIVSSSVDNLHENLDAIIVFLNSNMGETPEEIAKNYKDLMRNRAALLKGDKSGHPADMKTVSIPIQTKESLLLKDDIVQTMYDICGVPLASSSVTSGGDTGSARSLGNGWENAYNVALKEINCFTKADRSLLERILAICSVLGEGEVRNLISSEIEIRYSPNIYDNMMVKVEGYNILSQAGFPAALALEKTRLSNDPDAEGEMIEKHKVLTAEQPKV